MSQPELLSRVVTTLTDLGISYMVTGSIASSLQGEPRATHDVDIVVSLTAHDARRLAAAFRMPKYYLDESAMQSAEMFNMIDNETMEKVDFWLLTNAPFDRSRFERRYLERLPDQAFIVSRPEDTILMKLKWSQIAGGSEKQFRDALRVYEVQHGQLD